MTNENIKAAVVFLFFLVVVLAVNNVILTSKITSNVLDSLKREYVPGPYEPGFDPDKVPPKAAQ